MSRGDIAALLSGGAMKRKMVDKSKSAKEFRRNVGRTKAPNVAVGVSAGPMRGGWRL